MPNIFGTPPTIYMSNGNTFTLPLAARGGRDEDFKKVIKTWMDLENNIQQRFKGFRLQCSYRFDYVSDTNIDRFALIVNDTGLIKIKFQTLPPLYLVRVSEFKHGLADGLNSADAVEISFEGLQLVKSFPTPDLFYSMPPLLGRGLIVVSLSEQ